MVEFPISSTDSVELIGTTRSGSPSILSAITLGAGSAGNLTIATGNMIFRDGAAVTVSSEGTGNAGDLEVTARSIRMDNKGKLAASNTLGIGGGNIRLQKLNLLQLRRNSEISTNAGGIGNGGNINIDTDLLVGLENSDITATAVKGQGGNIQITTQGIFGIEPRSESTLESDITASSELGIDGVVEINRPDTDPSRGLVTLPEELVDVSGLVAQSCPAGGGNVAREESEFMITGRGGLPPTPQEATRSNPALADLGAPVQSQENRDRAAISSKSTSSEPTPIVEATGWVIGKNGEVVLIAQSPTVTPDIPWLTPTTCNAP